MQRPGSLEGEYFAREDAERLRELHRKEQTELAANEKELLRRLHHGRCSNCGAQLAQEQVSGIVVHHCPVCGGAFLEKDAWERIHSASEPHTLMGAVLNWFKVANKP
jgi:predicted RNA-binding Zn-ribbon protein involved in translation (DUF1610 family)